MFDPSYPTSRRRVDFSGKTQVEDKTSLLHRTRQERQQRQLTQHQHNAASSIQRWYRSHKQRRCIRITLRKHFDDEWKRYTAVLAEKASETTVGTAMDRQALMMRLVRWLWLFYDEKADGLRLLSLIAAAVKSNDSRVTSTHSFLHSRTLDSSQLPWPRQASHLCTLCLCKLIAETKVATSSSSSSPSPPDKRVYSLLVAALTLLLDHSRWNVQTLDAASIRVSALQSQQLLDSLASSPTFFPAFRLLLTRLFAEDSQPPSPFAIALLTSIAHAVTASSQRGAADAFSVRFVTDILTLPCIASSLRIPPLLPLFTTQNHHLTAHLLAVTRRQLHTTADIERTLPPSSSTMPSSAFLFGNLIQLFAVLDVKAAVLPCLMDYLSISTSFLQSLPPHLLHDDDEKTPPWQYDPTAKCPSPIHLPAYTLSLTLPVTPPIHTQLRARVLTQFPPLFTSSFFISLLHRAFLNSPSADIESLLSSYSLSSTSSAINDRLLQILADFIHREPSYLPSVCRLLTLAVSRSPFARSALSSLTFNSPILLMLWRTLEVSIGCKLTALHQPISATAEQVKASIPSSSLLSLFSTPKPTKPLPSTSDPSRAARLRWYTAIMGGGDKGKPGNYSPSSFSSFTAISPCSSSSRTLSFSHNIPPLIPSSPSSTWPISSSASSSI